MAAKKRKAWRSALNPIIGIVVLLAIWEGSVYAFKVPAYLLPPPSLVFAQIVTRMVQNDVALDQKVIRGSLDVMISTLTGTTPFGFTEPSAMEDTVAVFKQYGKLKTEQPSSSFFTNDFIKPVGI